MASSTNHLHMKEIKPCKICKLITNNIQTTYNEVKLSNMLKTIKIKDMFKYLQINIGDSTSGFCLRCIRNLISAYLFKVKCMELFAKDKASNVKLPRISKLKKQKAVTETKPCLPQNNITVIRKINKKEKINNRENILSMLYNADNINNNKKLQSILDFPSKKVHSIKNSPFNLTSLNDISNLNIQLSTKEIDTDNNYNVIQLNSVAEVNDSTLQNFLKSLDQSINTLEDPQSTMNIDISCTNLLPTLSIPEESFVPVSDINKRPNADKDIDELCKFTFVDSTERDTNNFASFDGMANDNFGLKFTSEPSFVEILNIIDENDNFASQKLSNDINNVGVNLNCDDSIEIFNEAGSASTSSVIFNCLFDYQNLLILQENVESAKYISDFDKFQAIKKKDKLVCFICHELFLTQRMLNIHLRMHNKRQIVCNICLKSFIDIYFIKSHKIHNEYDFNCLDCGKKFRSLSHNCQVKKKISNKFQCDFCKKIFMDAKQVKNHIRQKHNFTNKNMKYLCHICAESYSTKKLFQVHFKDAHKINKNANKNGNATIN